MPSAAYAKLEKTGSTESHDPMKNVLSMVEKKVRNLEKRKGRLDNLRADFNNGKELNEDQTNALKKYDQVIEILDFSKEMQKSIQVIIQECAKHQKREAKREKMERQQQDLHRIREILQLQDLLNNMGTDDVRQDFLAGSQGAVKLDQEDLDRLDELYKLVSPDRDSAKGEAFELQLNAAAEHLVGLLEGKNKEVLGGTATYKSMKELLNKINNSEYFSRGTKEVEEDVATEEAAPEEDKDNVGSAEFAAIPQEAQLENPAAFYGGGEPTAPPGTFVGQQALPEVLHVQGSFNFLQDSQVDVLPAHIVDPAVVAAQPMAPYHTSVTAAGQQEDFDPVGPIPTQTFTNQNYAMMGIAPGAYVGGPPQPMGMPVQPIPAAAIIPQPDHEDAFMGVQEFQGSMSSNSNQQQAPTTTQYHRSSDENEEGGDFTQQASNRGGFRGSRGGRGPRPSNGYSRRGFSNGRGGGYQNSNSNFYGDRARDNNYSAGQRRGSQNARAAAPRGGANGATNRGGPRGNRGGNFRPQQ